MSQKLFDILNKNDITPNEYYLLYCCSKKIQCKLPNSNVVAYLLKQGKYLDDKHNITDKSKMILEEIDNLYKKIATKASIDTLGEGYLDQIKSYRTKWPVGYRSSPDELNTKFSKLFLMFPDITWDLIQLAATLYLSEQSNPQYIIKSGNFLMKQDGTSGTKYPIYEYLERCQDGEETNIDTGYKSV